MNILPWIRKWGKPKINHDVLTRLGSAELQNLQHEVGNANLVLHRMRKQILRAIPDMYDAIQRGDGKTAVGFLESITESFLEMDSQIKRIDRALKEGHA